MKRSISVLTEVTEANTLLADQLRVEFAAHKLLVFNVIASPGAGKTTLLERTIEALSSEIRMAVIEGDPYTSLDAERISEAGVAAVQINTMGGCHLEARMIRGAIQQLDLSALDLVIIENVGNLVCPSGWDLGEDVKVVVASLTEGDDKPLKYPMAFVNAQAAVINKIDLEPYIPARVVTMRDHALQVNPGLDVMAVSAHTGAGMDSWYEWVRRQVAARQAR